MTTKIDKHDVKNPDALTQELKKGFAWSVQHSKMVAGAAAAFIFIGTAYSAFSYFMHSQEAKLQEKYYLTEKEYYSIKEKFEAPAPLANKDLKTQTTTVKATGDLEKDYGTVLTAWNNLIAEKPGSRAAMMAALHVSDIYSQYKKNDLALASLSKIQPKKDLLSALILDKKASLQAEGGDCKAALTTWDQILNNKKYDFMSAELKLKKGLCYETLNDTAQALAMYTQARDSDANSPTAKTAEKYLRGLQSKKN